MRVGEGVGAEGVSVGVDVGGTFTDLVAIHASGTVRVAKVLTTPADRSVGVLDAVVRAELQAAAVQRFVHGTTVVTNLLLERAGTRVVLLATAGFTDLLWLRRQERASLYDLGRHQPAPLVAAGDVIAVQERVAPRWFVDGRRVDAPDAIDVLTPLSDAELARVAGAARDSGATTFAIVLLHGYAYPTHEQQLHDAVRAACPNATIAMSHEVLPEIREYERTATTVAEAYARPAVRRYMRSLTSALAERGFPEPRVMTSAGGTIAANDADERAASLALSGPAGGVTAAAALCRTLGLGDALTIDIGGTSADVGLIVDGEPLVERGGVLDGVPIALPRVLVETVAAGGGSIGAVDAGGALQAGPESAGAVPGPASYGRGGTRATVTDAHVVLGHIAEGDWGGAVHIRAGAARDAVQLLSTALGRSVEDTARALVATADATMARALRRVSVERGRDPRDLLLVAFGGGGPLHACGLADIFVPPYAGVLSALGLALAPERRDGLANVMRRLDLAHTGDASAPSSSDNADELHRVLHTVRRDLIARLDDASSTLTARSWAHMRHLGQGHELDVPFHESDSPAQLDARFRALHEERFGYRLEQVSEVVSIRASLDGAWWTLASARPSRAASAPFALVDDGNALEARVVGPETVRLPDATLRVAAGWMAEALPAGGWWLTREAVA
jgi:N-methylhydantoinase A